MEKDEKAIALILGGGAVLGLVYLLRRRPEEGAAAQIGIVILDSEGNVVPHNSPATLQPGQSYTAVVTCQNLSTQGGQPVAVTLTISTIIYVGSYYFYDGAAESHSFSAGGTRTINYPFTVPLDAAGSSGWADTRVLSPDGAILDAAQERLTVAELEVLYGASIDIGV